MTNFILFLDITVGRFRKTKPIIANPLQLFFLENQFTTLSQHSGSNHVKTLSEEAENKASEGLLFIRWKLFNKGMSND